MAPSRSAATDCSAQTRRRRAVGRQGPRWQVVLGDLLRAGDGVDPLAPERRWPGDRGGGGCRRGGRGDVDDAASGAPGPRRCRARGRCRRGRTRARGRRRRPARPQRVDAQVQRQGSTRSMGDQVEQRRELLPGPLGLALLARSTPMRLRSSSSTSTSRAAYRSHGSARDGWTSRRRSAPWPATARGSARRRPTARRGGARGCGRRARCRTAAAGAGRPRRGRRGPRSPRGAATRRRRSRRRGGRGRGRRWGR